MEGGKDINRAAKEVAERFARSAAIAQSIETRLSRKVALWHSLGYVGAGGDARPVIGVIVDTVDASALGINLFLGGTYNPQGFNGVPAMTALIAARRRLGRSTMLLDGEYGRGLAQGESFSAARLSTFYRVRQGLHVGLGSRFGVDLERDEIEAPAERDWQVVAGPQAVFSGKKFFANLGFGISVAKLRLQPNLQNRYRRF